MESVSILSNPGTSYTSTATSSISVIGSRSKLTSRPQTTRFLAFDGNSKNWISENRFPLDFASVSNSFVKGSSLDQLDGIEVFKDSLRVFCSRSGKARECCPVSVLHGVPVTHSGQSCNSRSHSLYYLDQHHGSTFRLYSLSGDVHQYLLWRDEPQASCRVPEEYLGSFTQPQISDIESLDSQTVYNEQIADDILLDSQSRFAIFKDSFIVKAFKEAEKAHFGQYRANGDLYLVHCVETAVILATLGASKEVVAAGLLHDIVDDSAADYEELQDMFGDQVADLVKGVSQLSGFSKMARDHDTASKALEADRLHTMFLAMADVRVLLIKLADRLHNMRTLGALPEHKQLRIAKETLQIFVPLANRLGIWSWKAELEDLCFKHLNPQEHRILAGKLAGGFREDTILASIEKLKSALHNEGIPYHDLTGRCKNLYGIHKKMTQKCRSSDEIYDVQGVRLIMMNKVDCYRAADIVHKLWPQVSANIKDYIKHPKANGYQSLHTVVKGEDGFPLEVQIRTQEMHHQAEFGVAAHWRYKEDNVEHSPFVLQIVEWARWMLNWQNEMLEFKPILPNNSSLQSPGQYKEQWSLQKPPQSKDDPLLVIIIEDKKMTVHELPGGSTVSDLLKKWVRDDSFAATLGVGFFEACRPRVNHKFVVDTEQELKTGDLVEIMPLIPDDSLIEYRNKMMRMFTETLTREQAGCRDITLVT